MSIKEEIKKVHELTDQRTVRELYNRLLVLDMNNPETKEILQLAREKKIIL